MADADQGRRAAAGGQQPRGAKPAGNQPANQGRQTPSRASGTHHTSTSPEDTARDQQEDDQEERDEREGTHNTDGSDQLGQRVPEGEGANQQNLRGMIPAVVRSLHSASLPPEVWIMLGQMLYDVVMRWLDRRNDP